jgi:dihydrodipicolinate synthase/N-acetylneuraminate lyase
VLAKEIDWLIGLGVSGVVIAMVSEVMRFSSQERREQWKLVISLAANRVPVIVSVGAESTAIAVELARQATNDGASALMATPPAIFPATSEEIFNYYRSIVEATSLPVIVQDASNYMGQPLSLDLYEKLLTEFGTDRIQFKPEAKPVKERVAHIQAFTYGAAHVFEGQSGMDLLDTHSLGLFGTMPGSEIVWAITALWNALESSEVDRAQEIHEAIAKLITFQSTIDTYVAVEKFLLAKQGIFTSTRQRGPVSSILSSEAKMEIETTYDELRKTVFNN